MKGDQVMSKKQIEAILWLLRELLSIFLAMKKERKEAQDGKQ